MDISINGKKADITLETEKTVGDVLAGLDNWLTGLHGKTDSWGNGNFRLSGLFIDGIAADTQSMEDSFSRDITAVNTLDIVISSLRELIFTALQETQKAVETWKNLDFSARQSWTENWKSCPAAALISEQYPELFAIIVQIFSGDAGYLQGIQSGDGSGAHFLSAIIDERMRELENPASELCGMEKIIDSITGRLEELPLDIQTGKDRKASETIQIFTAITEKIFRIFNIFKSEGFPVETVKITPPSFTNSSGENSGDERAEIPIKDFLDEFSGALKQMLAAYEQKDAVLVGDLAEYEMAPRLRGFYETLRLNSEKTVG